MKKALSILMICVMLMGIFAGCTSQPAENSGSESGENSAGTSNEVKIYVESAINTLDPYQTVEYASCYVFNNIYETLIRIDENGDVVPWLAKDWTVSEDGLTYSFTIQEGVKFHNGEELKASDVAYSLNTAIASPAMSSYCSMMDSAEATGDYTFDLKLNTPYGALISMLQGLYIVNEAFYTANQPCYDVACGTGPYMLRDGSVDLNTSIIVDAFEDYHLGKASIETANFKIITDASTARIQLENGDLDFMMCYNVSDYQPLKDTGNFNTQLVQAPHTAYIALNLEKEPLNNKALRQALNYATDNESIIMIAYDGLAEPARALTGANSFGVDFSDATDYTYNPDKAKEKLVEAGFPDGINFDDYGIILEYIPGSYHEKIANCLKEEWSQVGIEISLRATESVDCAKGEHMMRTTGTDYKADMSYMAGKYASWNIGSQNYAFYKNDRVDEIFRICDASSDQAERAKLYKELTEIIVDDAPYIPIQHKEIPYAWAKDLNAKVYPSNECPYYVYEWSWK